MLNAQGEKTRTCAQSRTRGAGAVAGLEDERLDPARDQVRGGGQADGTGADDSDRQGRGLGHVVAPHQIHRRLSMRRDRSALS